MRFHDGLSSFLGVLEFYYFQSILTLHSLSDLVCTSLTHQAFSLCVQISSVSPITTLCVPTCLYRQSKSRGKKYLSECVWAIIPHSCPYYHCIQVELHRSATEESFYCPSHGNTQYLQIVSGWPNKNTAAGLLLALPECKETPPGHVIWMSTVVSWYV